MAVYYCGGNQKTDLQRRDNLKNLAAQFFSKKIVCTVDKISSPLCKPAVAATQHLASKPSKSL